MFPEFVYDDILHIKISCTAGYICWDDLYDIYDKDEELKSNLRKAPKLSYLTLHPGNNKQNVPLTLAVIHETAITAAPSYFPNQRDVANFLGIFNTWWTISNSKKRFSPNIIGDAVISRNKTELWQIGLNNGTSPTCPFTLTSHAHAMLTDDLLNEAYQYMITAQL